MEQALRIQHDDLPAPTHDGAARRTEEFAVSERIDKVLRFAMPPKPAEGDAAGKQVGFVTARDFAAAIDGVHEAAQAMRLAEERSREADGRTHTVAQRAAEELKVAEARIQALEARLRGAEHRAQEAEARAKEADAWLRQIFATIAEELPARKQG